MDWGSLLQGAVEIGGAMGTAAIVKAANKRKIADMTPYNSEHHKVTAPLGAVAVAALIGAATGDNTASQVVGGGTTAALMGMGIHALLKPVRRKIFGGK